MLICVDFQPAYQDGFPSLMKGLRKRLRQAARRRERVDFLYNDTWDIMGARLGDDHVDVLKWAEENNINITDARLLKKNFGWVSHWLRPCSRGASSSISQE